MRFLRQFIKRRIYDRKITTLREDIRRFGMVLVGGGVLSITLQSNWSGTLPAIVGMVVWVLALTEPDDD